MSTHLNTSETPIAEADLAKKIGVSKDILKEFRRQKLLKGEHFYAQQNKPITYTEAGLYMVENHFLGDMKDLLAGEPLTEEDGIVINDHVPGDGLTFIDGQRVGAPPVPGPQIVRPIVERLAVNPHILLCTVGPHRNVRVWVKSSANYIPKMEVPIDVDLMSFDHAALIDYGGQNQGRDPQRKGWWGVKL
jgi:hypothetical protein